MRFSAPFILTLLAAGCSARPATAPPAPAPADAGLEQRLQAATALKTTARLVFKWSMTDRDMRFGGEGAVRMQAPDRVRLDMFGPRGETLLAAALVGNELRIPPGPLAEMARRMLPAPDLMWSWMGVFKRPPNAALTSTRREADKQILVYQAGEESWIFDFVDDRLVRAEWQGAQGGKQTVEIKNYNARGVPSLLSYRDWREFREMNIELSQFHDAESFPADTWLPGVR